MAECARRESREASLVCLRVHTPLLVDHTPVAPGIMLSFPKTDETPLNRRRGPLSRK